MTPMVDLRSRAVRKKPFHYFLAENVLPRDVSRRLLSWATSPTTRWRRTRRRFYRLYERPAFGPDLPEELACLRRRAELERLRGAMERIFGVRLSSKVTVTLHKQLPGHHIDIHNDHMPAGHSYRLVIQLNEGWKPANGGYLVLFNSDDVKDIHRLVSPRNNTAFGFEVSKDSFHAVSLVKADCRVALVYKFVAKE